nr:hypothetical protein [Tanacetum cinerariifolium]
MMSQGSSQINEVRTFNGNIFETVSPSWPSEVPQDEHLDSDDDSIHEDYTIKYDQYLATKESQDVPTEASPTPPTTAYMLQTLTDLTTQVEGHRKVNQEQTLVNATLYAELDQCNLELARLERNKVKVDCDQVIVARNKRNTELEKAQLSQPTLYDGHRLLQPGHALVTVSDSHETLLETEVSHMKMSQKPGHVTPVDYTKLNALYDQFVPQKELSREQVYCFDIASQSSDPPKPVTPFVHTVPVNSEFNISRMLKIRSPVGSLDKNALETEITQLNDSITSLRIQNNGYKIEIANHTRRYLEVSKANTHLRTTPLKKIATQKAEIATLKAEDVGKKNSGPTGTPTKPKVLASRISTQKPPVQHKKPTVPVNMFPKAKPATKARKPIPKRNTQNHNPLPAKTVKARRAADHYRNLYVDISQFVDRSMKSVHTKPHQAKRVVNTSTNVWNATKNTVARIVPIWKPTVMIIRRRKFNTTFKISAGMSMPFQSSTNGKMKRSQHNRPYQMGTTRDTLGTAEDGGVTLGIDRPCTYNDLDEHENKRFDADIRATNIFLQGLPKDIYKLINHNTKAKAIWDNVKMLLAGSKLTKEDHKSQLYAEFEQFKMILAKLQFVNNMTPEWDRGDRIIIKGTLLGVQVQLGMVMHRIELGMLIRDKEKWSSATTVNGAVLDEEKLLFLAGKQANTYDADVDDQPVHDMSQNDPNVLNLENAINHHEIPNEVLLDSDSADMGNSNVIPYEQYVKHNEEFDVPSGASSVQYDDYMLHENSAYVPDNSFTTTLNIYKDQVAIYEQRAKFELTDHEQKNG